VLLRDTIAVSLEALTADHSSLPAQLVGRLLPSIGKWWVTISRVLKGYHKLVIINNMYVYIYMYIYIHIYIYIYISLIEVDNNIDL